MFRLRVSASISLIVLLDNLGLLKAGAASILVVLLVLFYGGVSPACK